MASIVISGNTYFSYATVAESDVYLIPTLNYATWSALTTDQKGGYLVSATRLLDSLTYIESADEQSERELIPAFAEATILIASLVASGSTAILGGTVEEAENKRLKAGSVEIENFRSLSSFYASPYSAWPQNIFLLIKPYLASLSSIGFSASFGTCGKSTIADYGLVNVN